MADDVMDIGREVFHTADEKLRVLEQSGGVVGAVNLMLATGDKPAWLIFQMREPAEVDALIAALQGARAAAWPQ